MRKQSVRDRRESAKEIRDEKGKERRRAEASSGGRRNSQAVGQEVNFPSESASSSRFSIDRESNGSNHLQRGRVRMRLESKSSEGREGSKKGNKPLGPRRRDGLSSRRSAFAQGRKKGPEVSKMPGKATWQDASRFEGTLTKLETHRPDPNLEVASSRKEEPIISRMESNGGDEVGVLLRERRTNERKEQSVSAFSNASQSTKRKEQNHLEDSQAVLPRSMPQSNGLR